MINALPIIGWVLSLIFSISLAIPFYIVWTGWGIGEVYFYFLPAVYHSVPFWDTVGFFMAVSILKAVLIPRIATVSNNSESK